MTGFRDLEKRLRRHQLWAPGAATQARHWDREAVKTMIPHREPILLVDAITAVDRQQQAIRGLRRIAHDDPVFRGHFPGDPVYPGVLLVEMMGQLCLCLHALTDAAAETTRLRLLKIHHAVFVHAVYPGDELTLLGQQISDTGITRICAGQALKDGAVCAAAIVEIMLADG